ncbi:TniQ family protein [Mesorhizobium sp. M1B.F.Ca.ET.045.04.1.1]|uniref:TniQ family protein n=1 Tax=Mesorhizobium sp. M1B.F.Ca.ET.045.04.1.1 TaxID=2493673 RepID=UPI001677F8A5|nr:TniQ family protein [Mesorhizobium sp. M1B.F.Ca.ET.045.04.1.1]
MLVKAADLNVPGAANYFRGLLGSDSGRLVTSIDPKVVARFCRVDADVLAHASPVFEGVIVSLMGQRFRRRDYAISERRWCPSCLAENGSHRTWWDLTHVTSCPRHGMLLHDACACGAKTRWARSASLVACRCGRWLKDTPAKRPAWIDCGFDSYLIDRFLGHARRPVPWLDELPMFDVIDTVRIVGEFVLDPFQEKGFANTVEGRHQLMAAGFRTITEFPTTIEATLAGIYSTRSQKLQAPHRMHSKEFRVWLTTGDETPMKKTIRRAIRRWTIRHAPGIGGYDVPYGYFALRHAGYLCDYSPDALLVVLRHKRPKAWNQPVGMERIDPETMAWLVRHVGGRIGEEHVAAELDVAYRELTPLRRDGLIDTFVRATGAVYGFFSPDEPDRLVRKLLKLRDGDFATDARTMPMPVAARELNVPVAKLINAIFEGRLRVAGTSKRATGLSRIRIDLDAAAELSLPSW